MSTQIVRVAFPEGGRVYSYKWNGEVPLKMTDTVVTPANWKNKEEGLAVVVGFGTDFTGPLAEIVRLHRGSTEE